MLLHEFMRALGMQKPLLAVCGDIFNTPADHICFAVHWPNKEGYTDNDNGGFASKVAEYGWDDIGSIVFEKGVPISRMIRGKYFHALPVHANEEGGWDDAPDLIERCLNNIPVASTEVIATVLMGGGNAGEKYKASVRNIEGMLRSYKTVVLYIFDEGVSELLAKMGISYNLIPENVSLLNLPKVYKYGERMRKEIGEITEAIIV